MVRRVFGPGALLGPEGTDLRSTSVDRGNLPFSDAHQHCCSAFLVGGCGWGAGGVACGPVHTKLFVLVLPGCARWWGCGWVVGGDRDRPSFENCTVDASIFIFKLVRAHGGCLGTRSR